MRENETAVAQRAQFPRPRGYCSFCKQSPNDVGGLVEGPDQVYICFECALLCARIINAESQRLAKEASKPQKA